MKERLLEAAELIDAFRVFPRLFLLGYGVLGWQMALWAMSLSTLSVEQAGLVGVVAGLFVPMTNFYMNTGRDWKSLPLSQSVVTTQRVETQEQPQSRGS